MPHLKVAVVVGTRPGIIKMAPLIHEASIRNIDCIVIHTGQHYSINMDYKIYNLLNLPKPHYSLKTGIKGSTHAEQTAAMLIGVEKVVLKEKPNIVFVCGDANTNMASALAARKVHTTVGHVEAGLRSNDWFMPEEHNRVIIDHISEFLFAPTEEAADNLAKENVRGSIHVVGNTIVDSINHYLPIAREQSIILKKHGLIKKDYYLVTLHREENVDNPDRLRKLLEALFAVKRDHKSRVIFPIHPRTKKRVGDFGYDVLLSESNIQVIEPVDYIDMLQLLDGAKVVLTDSGGLQEEACIIKVPCVTLRNNTERPDTVGIGSNIVAGIEPVSVLDAVKIMSNRPCNW